MNISSFACGNYVYARFERVRDIAFRKSSSWVNSAVLAVFCHLMTAIFACYGITMPVFGQTTVLDASYRDMRGPA